MKELFLDIETTGLDPHTGQIIEITILKESGQCLLSTRYNIDPALQTPEVIQAALDYNKLSLDELSFYQPLDKDGITFIATLLKNSLVIAHNVEFDKAFLEQTSLRLTAQNLFKSVKWDCTMQRLAKSKSIKSGRVKLPNMQSHNVPHSSLHDCQNARLLWQSFTPQDWNW